MSAETSSTPREVRGMIAEASYSVSGEPTKLAGDLSMMVGEASSIIDLVIEGMQEHDGTVQTNPEMIISPLRAAMRLLALAGSLSESIELQTR